MNSQIKRTRNEWHDLAVYGYCLLMLYAAGIISVYVLKYFIPYTNSQNWRMFVFVGSGAIIIAVLMYPFSKMMNYFDKRELSL